MAAMACRWLKKKGDSMATVSPGLHRARSEMAIASWQPVVTMTSSGVSGQPAWIARWAICMRSGS